MSPRTILVISTHSFVDLITNSSSELFVCDTKKTLGAVKDLLRTLLKNHNEIEGEDNSFESVFGTIDSVKYTFDWWKVPQTLRDEYKYFHHHCDFGRSSYDLVYSNERNGEEEELQQQAWRIEEKHNTREKGLYERDKDEYDRRWKACRKEEDALWTPYGAKKLKSDNVLFLEFLRQNKFTKEQIAQAEAICDAEVKRHLEEKCGEYTSFKGKFPSPELTEAHETFREWTSWGITAKKGDIFVYSKSDNTIPYKLMDTISSYLNAARYHLG